MGDIRAESGRSSTQMMWTEKSLPLLHLLSHLEISLICRFWWGGLRLCISHKLPGYASSACLVTTILCSKVLEDPVNLLPVLKTKNKKQKPIRLGTLLCTALCRILFLSQNLPPNHTNNNVEQHKKCSHT